MDITYDMGGRHVVVLMICSPSESRNDEKEEKVEKHIGRKIAGKTQRPSNEETESARNGENWCAGSYDGSGCAACGFDNRECAQRVRGCWIHLAFADLSEPSACPRSFEMIRTRTEMKVLSLPKRRCRESFVGVRG